MKDTPRPLTVLATITFGLPLGDAHRPNAS
jgi:hypothetical protein